MSPRPSATEHDRLLRRVALTPDVDAPLPGPEATPVVEGAQAIPNRQAADRHQVHDRLVGIEELRPLQEDAPREGLAVVPVAATKGSEMGLP